MRGGGGLGAVSPAGPTTVHLPALTDHALAAAVRALRTVRRLVDRPAAARPSAQLVVIPVSHQPAALELLPAVAHPAAVGVAPVVIGQGAVAKLVGVGGMGGYAAAGGVAGEAGNAPGGEVGGGDRKLVGATTGRAHAATSVQLASGRTCLKTGTISTRGI